MPPIEFEARVAQLKGCAMTIDTRLVEMQKFLNEAMHMWTTMEEVDGLIEFRALLQKNQQEFDELTTTMKDLTPLEHMFKMKERTKLQTELHKL